MNKTKFVISCVVVLILGPYILDKVKDTGAYIEQMRASYGYQGPAEKEKVSTSAVEDDTEMDDEGDEKGGGTYDSDTDASDDKFQERLTQPTTLDTIVDVMNENGIGGRDGDYTIIDHRVGGGVSGVTRDGRKFTINQGMFRWESNQDRRD